MNPVLYQALIRAARTIAAAAIAAAVVTLPQVIGAFSLGPQLTAVVIALLAGLLNGIGKYVRGASADVNPAAGGDKLPI